MERDCLFIGMRFLTLEFPKEKKFLLKYFKGKLQRYFIRYITFFGDYKNFADHTGLYCSLRWLKQLESKYRDLIYIHGYAKANMDLELLAEIESGDILLKNNIKKYKN